MTIEDPEGEFDTAAELLQARKIYFKTKEAILALLDQLKDQPDAVKGVKDLDVAGAQFRRVLNNLSKLGDDVGKQSDAIRGVLQGGALDLEAARTEVLGRYCSPAGARRKLRRFWRV